jgi:hypothetical protein
VTVSVFDTLQRPRTYFGPDGWVWSWEKGGGSLSGEPRRQLLGLVAAELGPDLAPGSASLATSDELASTEAQPVIWRTYGVHPSKWPAIVHAYYREHPIVRSGLELERACATFEDARSRLALAWFPLDEAPVAIMPDKVLMDPAAVRIDGPILRTVEVLVLDGGAFAHGVTQTLLERWGVSLETAVAAARARVSTLGIQRHDPGKIPGAKKVLANPSAGALWISGPPLLGMVVSELERIAPDQIGPLGTLLWSSAAGFLWTRPLSHGAGLRHDLGWISAASSAQSPDAPLAFPRCPLWRRRDGKVRRVHVEATLKDNGGYHFKFSDGPLRGALCYLAPEGDLLETPSWAQSVDKVTYTRFAGIAAVALSEIAGTNFGPAQIGGIGTTLDLQGLLPIARQHNVETWPDLLREAFSIFGRDAREVRKGRLEPRAALLSIPGLKLQVQATYHDRVGISMETKGDPIWREAGGRLALARGTQRVLEVHGLPTGELFEPMMSLAHHFSPPAQVGWHGCRPDDHAEDDEIVWFASTQPWDA